MNENNPKQLLEDLARRYRDAAGTAYAAGEDEKAKNYWACAELLTQTAAKLLDLPGPATRS